jgi:type II secretory pathway component GspD/PulD (secretin)
MGAANRHRWLSRWALLISLSAMAACAGDRPRPSLNPVEAVEADEIQGVLQEADALMAQSRFEEAVVMLKAAGETEAASERMDGILYRLAQARVGMGDPARAVRCCALLRQYYPRSGYVFPDLAVLESQANAKLALTPGTQTAPSSDPKDDASPISPNPESSAPAGPLVQNSFYETDVMQALTDISAQTKVPIVPDPMIRGLVTGECQDVPLEACLDRLLTPLGLTYRKTADYYLVGAPVEESPVYPLLTETVRIQPRQLTAEQAAAALPKFYEKYLRVDPRTNMLAITGSRAIIDAFREDLAALDRPAPQVMIDALVVEMSAETRRELGVTWDYQKVDGSRTYQANLLRPMSADSLLVLGFSQIAKRFDLGASLRALATRGKVKIRANPRLTTSEGQEAQIRIARETYFSLVQGSVNFPYFTLEKIAAGITLKITPYVGASSEIQAHVVAEVSDVLASGINGLPVTNVRTVDTRIHTLNGETFGIGGLNSESQRNESSRIPLLGDIPILGALFGHTTTERVETEVMILITPTIVIPREEFDPL